VDIRRLADEQPFQCSERAEDYSFCSGSGAAAFLYGRDFGTFEMNSFSFCLLPWLFAPSILTIALLFTV